MSQQKFPPGWDQARVQRVIDHYESLSDDEMIAEDEAAHAAGKNQLPVVPKVHDIATVKGTRGKKKGKQPKALPRSKRLKEKGAKSASKG